MAETLAISRSRTQRQHIELSGLDVIGNKTRGCVVGKRIGTRSDEAQNRNVCCHQAVVLRVPPSLCKEKTFTQGRKAGQIFSTTVTPKGRVLQR